MKAGPNEVEQRAQAWLDRIKSVGVLWLGVVVALTALLALVALVRCLLSVLCLSGGWVW